MTQDGILVKSGGNCFVVFRPNVVKGTGEDVRVVCCLYSLPRHARSHPQI